MYFTASPSHAHTHAQTHKCFLVPSMHEHECTRRSADAACSLDSHAERNTATARRLSSRSIPALEKLETPTLLRPQHVGTLGSLLERLHERRFFRLLSRKGEYLAYLTYTHLKGRSRIRWARNLVNSGGGDFFDFPRAVSF